MDKWEHLRTRQPLQVLGALGIDISQLKKRSGKQEWSGRCPLPGHNPKHNLWSFSIHENGLFQCFSCLGKGKGNIDLTKLIRGCGFQEAVAFLEERFGSQPVQSSDTKKEPRSEAPIASDGELKPFTGKYHKYAVPCRWLEERIPDASIRERYGVFQYHNPTKKSAFSGRVMLPVKDVEGVLYGYLGRSIADTSDNRSGQSKDGPKYLFPKNLPKSQFLFGAHELWDDRPHRIVYLVESPFAVMKFASLGLQAVSPFGWSVSEPQVEILRQIARGLVWLPDANKRQDAKSLVSDLAARLWIRFPELPAQIQDPEHLSKEQILLL